MDPAPKIKIFDISYSLKINLLNRYNTAIISTFANIINVINDIFVKKLKSKKVNLSIENNDEFTVFVNVRIDNLNEFSKLKLSKVKMPDKIKIEIINKISTKKAILTS